MNEETKTVSPKLVTMSKLLLKSANKEPWRNINWVRDEGDSLKMTNGHYFISVDESASACKRIDPAYILAGEFKNPQDGQTQSLAKEVTGKPIKYTINHEITDYFDLTIDRLSPKVDGYTVVKLNADYLRQILSVIEQEETIEKRAITTVSLAIKGELDPVKLFGAKKDYAVLMPIKAK